MATTEKRSHYQLTFAVLATGMASYALLQSMVSPVLSLLVVDLHTTQNTVTWVLTAYLLSASISTPILGRIGDAYGKERMLLVSLGALGIGSVLAALAPSIGVLIVARAIQGIGGGIIPVSFGIIRDEFPREKVTGAVGVLAALLAVGGGVGLVLAGPIVNTLNYHWLFWIPAIVVVVAFVMAFIFVPESPVRTPGKVSWGAGALLSVWLVALLVGVSQAPSWGWLSPKVLGLIAASLVLAVLWVVMESRSDNPLIDMKMMRLPAVWTTNLAAFLFGFAMYSVFAFVPEFVQTPKSAGYGFSSDITQSGLIVLPQAVLMFVFGVLSGPLAKRFSGKAVMVAGSVISVVPFLMFAFFHSSLWEAVFACGLMGVGFGLGFSAMSAIIVDAVPPAQTGVASGMNANIRTIGGAIGAAVMGSVVTSHLQSDGLPKESGYTAGFTLLAAAMLAAAFAALLIPNLKRRTDPHSAEQRKLSHPEMALVAGGTVVGDESE
ncbi:MAG: Multidrug resistance transporter, superfamily protein [Pseudonocardiales bacterium]|nr:Multidrug resistance transporter, superfamily protein [Pseudonocardiales bacterium]